MDELESQLNAGDYTVIARIISKLIENIKVKHREDPNKEGDVVELKFLKEKCLSFTDPVSYVACKGLLHLVENDILNVKTILTDFISIVTTTKCSSNIVFLMNRLLIHDMYKQISICGKYESIYNLRLPQHPLVTMLLNNSKCWPKIFNEIVYQEETTDNRIELYKPIYLLVFCNPNFVQPLELFKLKLWSFLIYKPNTINCILTLLGWMQTQSVEVLRENSDLLVELAEVNCYNEQIIETNPLVSFLISHLCQLISKNLDPTSVINIIRDTVEKDQDIIIINSLLLTMAKIIPLSSPLYVVKILELCELLMLTREGIHPISLQAVKASLLQWITSPSLLTSDITNKSSQLFTAIENVCDNQKKFIINDISGKFFSRYHDLVNTTSDGCISLLLSVQMEHWKSEGDFMRFLAKLEDAPAFFIEKIVHFLFGILSADFISSPMQLILFHIILKCGEKYDKLQTRILTLLIYKLSNTHHSEFHYQILKALPKLAKSKNNSNAQKILRVIQTLTSETSGALETFGTTLMFDLWKIDNRFYSYLENLLTVPYRNAGGNNLWEFYVTRAYILKEICILKPEIHGKEMVAYLSKILNECHDPNGALACALAIEGITALCKVEIIDAVTTWAALAPIFKNDSRVAVIESLCGFFSEIPNLSYAESQPQLTQDVIKTLWDYIRTTTDAGIWKAALRALSCFNMEEIMTQMPEEYVTEDEVTNFKQGIHSPTAPFWINFLKRSTESTMPLAEQYLIEMVSLEIDGYLKYVYQVKGAREPSDYSYLPANSIVKTIGYFLKTNVQKWISSVHEEVYLECLKIFSQVYSKPLPPLDWSFLQELMQNTKAKNYCVSIASHQVMLSGTARRLIENYLTALSENYENEGDVLHLYSNLKHISNSIQPTALKPFMEVTMLKAVDSFEKGDEDCLRNIVKYLRETLENEGIQDINKSVIAEIIATLIEETEEDTKIFSVLLECAEVFPLKNLTEISASKSVKDPTVMWFKKALKIRCKVALNASNSPLNWLNDPIEIGHKFGTIIPLILDEFCVVFKYHKDNTESALWLLDFIGQMQALIAEKSDTTQILFQCDVFMVATLIFSGYFVFLNELNDLSSVKKLFPQAIATLIDVNHWSICANQILEWFYHMNSDQMFPTDYQKIFRVCLQALRHEDEFKKNVKWMKYLNAK